jgi:hypothetical protein
MRQDAPKGRSKEPIKPNDKQKIRNEKNSHEVANVLYVNKK